MQDKKLIIIAASELQRTSATILKRCYKDKEHFVVERGGFPVAAIIPIDEYEEFKRTQKNDNR